MEPRFRGRVALVTGAGRGIGRAVALCLAREGAAVGLVSRTRAQLEQVAEEIRAQGGRALVAPADVCRAEQVDASLALVQQQLGPVDTLVNNAGALELMRFEEVEASRWWGLFEANVQGTYLFCRAVSGAMASRGFGRIVNVASAAAKLGFAQNTAYCAAKHAVLGLTRALALELAERGVTVNAVCPGYVQTALLDDILRDRARLSGSTLEAVSKATVERCPQKALISPQEVADAVLFLASHEARRTTGEALNVSGGLAMH